MKRSELGERRLVSLQKAAAWADASEITIRRMLARNELTRYQLGRVIRVDLDELDRVMRGGSGYGGAA